MKIQFFKYEGAGNDFVMIDNRINPVSLSAEQIALLCDRHFGVGGDGIMLVERIEDADFYMRYYNSDGSEAEMCGNGGRCIALFAHHLGIGGDTKHFKAKDGFHSARIVSADSLSGKVAIGLIDIDRVDKIGENKFTLNSGVPHYVEFADDAKFGDICDEARKIRYEINSNVNYAHSMGNDVVCIRTYERGVEGETLACGTGAAATAVALHFSGATSSEEITVKAVGGELKISFDYVDNKYHNVLLTGGARQVFKGEITI